MSQPPDRVPTLTEVVAWPDSALPAAAQLADDADVAPPAVPSMALPTARMSGPTTAPMTAPKDAPTDAPKNAPTTAAPTTAPSTLPPSPIDEQLAQRVLAEVQRQIDLTLEYRIRETLTPLLARFGDNLVREARHELASALRDVVARAVAQELARHRGSGTAR